MIGSRENVGLCFVGVLAIDAAAMRFELAVVATKPLLDGGAEELVGGDGVATVSGRLKHGTRVEVHHAECVETRAFGFESEMAGVAAIKILLHDSIEMS